MTDRDKPLVWRSGRVETGTWRLVYRRGPDAFVIGEVLARKTPQMPQRAGIC